ncbi:MAG: hypothetical protein ACRD44_10745, partial [Bryobacteraceae bacterium]
MKKQTRDRKSANEMNQSDHVRERAAPSLPFGQTVESKETKMANLETMRFEIADDAPAGTRIKV